MDEKHKKMDIEKLAEVMGMPSVAALLMTHYNQRALEVKELAAALPEHYRDIKDHREVLWLGVVVDHLADLFGEIQQLEDEEERKSPIVVYK
jgi:hypothetical protein